MKPATSQDFLYLFLGPPRRHLKDHHIIFNERRVRNGRHFAGNEALTKAPRGGFRVALRKIEIQSYTWPDSILWTGCSKRRGDYLDGTPILVRTEMASKSGPTPILCVQKTSKKSPNIDPIWVQKTLVATELRSNLSTEVDFSRRFFFFKCVKTFEELQPELVIPSSPSLNLIRQIGCHCEHPICASYHLRQGPNNNQDKSRQMYLHNCGHL